MHSKFFKKPEDGDGRAKSFIEHVWRTEYEAKKLQTGKKGDADEKAEGLTDIEPMAETILSSVPLS